MDVVSDQPETNGRASIREVYRIVSELEAKFVIELRLSEDRITKAVEDMRRTRSSDIERMYQNVKRLDDLETWKDEVEQKKLVSAAVATSRWWLIQVAGRTIEDRWRSLSVIVLVLLFIIGRVRVEF